jgi:hypothetical protein
MTLMMAAGTSPLFHLIYYLGLACLHMYEQTHSNRFGSIGDEINSKMLECKWSG